ncbi:MULTISPECIES: type II toxin-antitoxin system RelE/ParE family toxin [unclassified Duganella]|uniref:type II toxin-antitoxin system RelE/ParE family toxin n=1 Tax=unclassified Duganella TaxID=2636909 RepID=UPI000E341FE9|nr:MULTISPECIES: type II toxin-antitoxin system RelE/ParE family toxin [unclassified Duganella]RFP11894.1 type II toxin-antitoxin system RelE/ParE family toxin [Duganella sp. BJB475]RFP31460.1 type II toxin-antitoxin system RelE/ParE family toxin [Duganella sp. BJB476]
MWAVVQTRRFARQYKKLQDKTAADVDNAVSAIQAVPHVGERKKGDLAALRVYKFRSGSQQYLLGYSLDEGIQLIYLEAVGPHENFYRDVKR